MIAYLGGGRLAGLRRTSVLIIYTALVFAGSMDLAQGQVVGGVAPQKPPASSKSGPTLMDECLNSNTDTTEAVTIGDESLSGLPTAAARDANQRRYNPRCDHSRLAREANNAYYMHRMYIREKEQIFHVLALALEKQLGEPKAEEELEELAKNLKEEKFCTTEDPGECLAERKICPTSNLIPCGDEVFKESIKTDKYCLENVDQNISDCYQRLKRLKVQNDAQYHERVLENNASRANMISGKNDVTLGGITGKSKEAKDSLLKAYGREKTGFEGVKPSRDSGYDTKTEYQKVDEFDAAKVNPDVAKRQDIQKLHVGSGKTDQELTKRVNAYLKKQQANEARDQKEYDKLSRKPVAPKPSQSKVGADILKRQNESVDAAVKSKYGKPLNKMEEPVELVPDVKAADEDLKQTISDKDLGKTIGIDVGTTN